MAEMEQQDPTDLVLERDVEVVLKKDKGGSAKLKKFEIKNFTQFGDNYTSTVSSIIVQYEFGKRVLETSYVVKINAGKGKAMEKMLEVIFEKEINFFSEITPLMNKELESIGEVNLKLPKYFHSNDASHNEVIFLEDLRKHGFIMYDRKKGLDKRHTILVLKELGRFHGASVILFTKNQIKGKEILKRFPSTEDAMLRIFSDSSSPFNMNSVFGQAMSSIADMIDGIEGYAYAVEFLRSKMNSCQEIYEAMLKTEDRMSVLCHGDCWNNNFLFKYDSKGNPTDCRLVDLQSIRVGSPALDINYLFFTSLNGDVRQEHLNDFLSVYYASFASTVSSGKLVVPFTLDDLVKSYYSKNLFGLLIASATIPAVLMDQGEAERMEQSSKDVYGSKSETELMKAMDDYRQKTVQQVKTNPMMKPRLLAMFDELREAGIMGGGSVLSLIKTFNAFKRQEK